MTTQTTESDLTRGVCKACEGGVDRLDDAEVKRLLRDLPGWQQRGHEIAKTYHFRNYFETMAFVNAIAWISHREDHHRDLEVGYNTCVVRYSTHAAGGLSGNDFICASKVEAILKI